jgi:hypothetical protein
MNMGVGGGASAALLELTAAIDAYGRAPMPAGSDELGEELIALRGSLDRLEVRFSQLAAGHAVSGAWQDEGYVSPYHWLRNVCHMASGQAVDRVHVGLQLESLPRSAAALALGEIGYTHLALIAETGRAITDAGRPFDEEKLLARAIEKDVTRFRHDCHHLRHAADPQGYAEDQAAEVEESFLELRLRQDGGAWLKGAVDREGAAALKSALEPLARRSGEDDYRNQEQLNAHALVELARHALDAGSIPGRPHLQVTASFETLAGHTNAPAGELEFSLPICRATVERLACDCSLTRVLLDSDSMVIDVGRTMRVVNGSRSRALRARDKGCRFPGCDRPASWTNAHHLVHWARGGTTHLDNLVLLCHRHHWLVHEGGWRLVKGDGGKLLAIPPMAGFNQRGPVAPAIRLPEPQLIHSG